MVVSIDSELPLLCPLLPKGALARVGDQGEWSLYWSKEVRTLPQPERMQTETLSLARPRG